MWANHGGSNNINKCGLGADFNGLLCIPGQDGTWCSQPADFPPGDLMVKNGAVDGPVQVAVTGSDGACDPGTFTGGPFSCKMLVPVCTGPGTPVDVNGNSHSTLHCVGWAQFKIGPGKDTGNLNGNECLPNPSPGNNIKVICGLYEGEGSPADDGTPTGTATDDGLYRIALVQ